MRLDGIGISGFPANKLFVNNVIKMEEPKETPISGGSAQEDIAVRLSISGKPMKLKSFGERIREDDPNDPLLSGMSMEVKKQLLAQEEGKIVMLDKTRLLPVGASKAEINSLFETYAKRYDELVQGHKDGKRSIFITDSETGEFRPMTLEEELQELNEYLNSAIDTCIKMVEQNPERVKFYERRAIKMKEYAEMYGGDMDRAIEAREQAEEMRRKVESMPEPEECRKRIYEAIQSFLKQYAGWKEAGMDVESMTNKITIFETDVDN